MDDFDLITKDLHTIYKDFGLQVEWVDVDLNCDYIRYWLDTSRSVLRQVLRSGEILYRVQVTDNYDCEPYGNTLTEALENGIDKGMISDTLNGQELRS